jgi:hypothetical protein
MTNSTNVTPKAKKILDDILEELKDSDEPTESHLPQEIFDLDKATLLAIVYRLVARVRD